MAQAIQATLLNAQTATGDGLVVDGASEKCSRIVWRSK